MNENVKWYYPTKYEHAVKIHLEQPDFAPVGGTTGILRTRRHKYKGFIDLKKCDLDRINLDEEKKIIKIGSMVTFNQLIDFLNKENLSDFSFLKMLKEALIDAASYPLRNRITIGGSLYDLPIWSDLISPLCTASTKVIYNDEQQMDILKYLRERKKFAHIIKEIEIQYDENIKYLSERFSLTKFDYATLRVGIAISFDKSGKIEYLKSCVSGTKDILFYDDDFDKKFLNLNLNSEDAIKDILDSVNFNFSSDYRFSAEYKQDISKKIFLDLLEKVK